MSGAARRGKSDGILALDGKSLGRHRLAVTARPPRRTIAEATPFEIFLRSSNGALSQQAVAHGIHFAGRVAGPGERYRPWLEAYYEPVCRIDERTSLDLAQDGLDEVLFRHFSSLLPPGSHIMAVYLRDGATTRGLERGYPPAATPIGRLLWKAGCRWFKDWYFSEGFCEGDVKLQGNKPLSEAGRRRNEVEAGKELAAFLARPELDDDLDRAARATARELLAQLRPRRASKEETASPRSSRRTRLRPDGLRRGKPRRTT